LLIQLSHHAPSRNEVQILRQRQLDRHLEETLRLWMGDPKRLNKSWGRAKGATNKLIRILQSQLLLDKSKFFTSKNALVPLIYYLALERGKPLQKEIQRFFLLSQVSEHYGAAAETALNRDFRALGDPEITPRQGFSNLVRNVDREARQYYRGLKVHPEQVEGLPSKNVLLLLMYIVMRKLGATEWGTGDTRRLDEIDPTDLHLHHIFPFNFMAENKLGRDRFADDGLSPADYRAEINGIANLTFLGKEVNSAIGDEPPWVYLPQYTTKGLRKAHFIPEDTSLWKIEKFPEFLKARRRLLAKAITKLMKS
jgi:hypothetical protein